MMGLASQGRIAGDGTSARRAYSPRRAQCAFESPAWFVIGGSTFEPLVISLRTQPTWTGDPRGRATEVTCCSGTRSN
jgi:hypothetical protein